MSETMNVLVVGATGSIGRLVVTEALERGYPTRALVRSDAAATGLDERAEVVVGDLTDADSLATAVSGVDAVVFTHGSRGGADPEGVDYGARVAPGSHRADDRDRSIEAQRDA